MKSTASLHRYALAQAAAELGVHAVTLRKALKARGIEPSGPGGFTLAELVASQLADGGSAKERSLEAHAALLSHKAQLTQLQVSEKQGSLIPRAEAHQFMRGLIEALYSGLCYDVAWPAEQAKVERMVFETCVRHYGFYGWALEPTVASSQNGQKRPPTRQELWASLLCSMVTRPAKEEHDRSVEPTGGERRVKPGRRRDRETSRQRA